ncbi:MAG: hypothetical protein K8E24_014535, partial [Methanobacterium paludis]|nr:hypothetical protein [Methanobacterium paludis]
MIDHDGTITTSPASGATITMADNFYCRAYDLDETTFQMLLVKPTQTSIKTTQIPADDITGIGYFDYS